MNHLSDEDLQKYLDKDPELNKAQFDRHLKACDHCRKNYIIYKQLYAGLANEAGFMLSANFSESVVSRIRKKQEKTYSFFETVLLTIAGLFSMGLLFYFTNLGDLLLGTFNKNVQELEPFLKGIGDVFGGNLTIFIFAIVIIILFGVADKLIFQMKHR
jgi:archaellum biogenesis protein FlaJ (TadC family)